MVEPSITPRHVEPEEAQDLLGIDMGGICPGYREPVTRFLAPHFPDTCVAEQAAVQQLPGQAVDPHEHEGLACGEGHSDPCEVRDRMLDARDQTTLRGVLLPRRHVVQRVWLVGQLLHPRRLLAFLQVIEEGC